MTTAVRVRDDTKEQLRALAQATGRPMGDVLADAVESYRRTAFLATAADAYAASQPTADPDAALWEATLADGVTE